MTSIAIKAVGASIFASVDGKLTSGMVGIPVTIEYDDSWHNLTKTVVFRVGDFSRDRKNINTTTTVPWEVMRYSGKPLQVGIEGRDESGNIVMPTTWTSCGTILQGANASIPGAPNPDGGETPGGGSVKDAVLYTAQTLTEEQKAQARMNIGAAHNEEVEKGYVTKSVTDTVVMLTEADPRNVVADLNAQKTTIYGVNHFEIYGASLTHKGGYSSFIKMTKENNGIKIVSALASSGVYTWYQTDLVAPFDGVLYCSCEADCTGPIQDVCFTVKVNEVEQTKCYGKGLLYQAVEVAKGDTVSLLFYTHMGSTEGNTIYYKNIQVAYGGLYDFTPYREPIKNVIERQAEKTFTIPADSAAWSVADTFGAGGLYRFVTKTGIPDMASYPSQSAIPQGVTVEGIDLVTYNQTYNGVEGLGIDGAGKVSIFLTDVQTIENLATYLESNPITITYTSTEAEEVRVEIDKSLFYQGEILEFETAQEVSYKYKPQEKNITCVCFGDSITGMFANKTDYPSMMEVGTDLICHNVGFSGTQLTDHSGATYQPFSMNRLADAVVSGDFSTQDAKAATAGGLYPVHLETLKSIDFNEVDFVTLLYGTNDWQVEAILKSADDTATENKQHTNVEDALKYSISTLLTAYPHLRIIVLTPYWRAVSSGKDSDIDANGDGVFLYEYADYIQKVAEESYHVPTINLYRTSGANAITNRYFTNDGTHPTERMKHIIASKIIKMINENR